MCPNCHRRLVEIAVRVNEVKFTMHACSACEHRWWDRDGQTVELGSVLALASARS